MPSIVRHLYAHIPFCPSKCSYCAFVTHIGSLKLVQPYLDALVLEAGMLATTRPGGPLETVYLGGGTPSLLSPAQLSRFLRVLDQIFGLADSCEVTIEAHPDTVDLEKLRGFRAAGANRISMGGESLDAGELSAIGRKHEPQRVLEVVRLARKAEFRNISLDFMYGLPGQTQASWNSTLERAVDADVDHLSLYPLSIEPGTVFGRRWKQQLLQVPDDDSVAEMYHQACAVMRAGGYHHYEVANWARPGYRARHNLAYWRNREFYAIGVGAHGYLKPTRTENVRQTGRYIETVMRGESPCVAEEPIDQALEYSETVMLGLRLLEDGIDLHDIKEKFNVDLLRKHRDDVDDLTKSGLLKVDGHRMLITESAVPVANEIWGRFVM